MSNTVHVMNMVVVVPKVGTATTFQDLMVMPFTPFDDTVWYSLLLVLCYVGLVRWAIEPAEEKRGSRRDTNIFLRDEEGNAEVVLRAAKKAAKGLVRRKQTSELAHAAVGPSTQAGGSATAKPDDKRTLVHSLTDVFYHQGVVIKGCMGDWRGDDPSTLSGWILLIGASFSMLVITSFYQAQVAITLLFEKQDVQFTSLDEVIDAQKKVCMLQAMQAAFEATYDRAMVTSAPGGFSGLLEAMDDDDICSVAVMPQEVWEQLGLGVSDHCKTKSALAATVFSISLVFPVRPELVLPLSYAFEFGREQGVWGEVWNSASNAHMPTVSSSCEVSPPASDASRRRLASPLRQGASEALQEEDGPSAQTVASQNHVKPRQDSRRLAGSAASVASATASTNSNSGSAANTLKITGAGGALIIAVLMATAALLLNCIGRVLHLTPSYLARLGIRETCATSHPLTLSPSSVTEAVKKVSSQTSARLRGLVAGQRDKDKHKHKHKAREEGSWA